MASPKLITQIDPIDLSSAGEDTSKPLPVCLVFPGTDGLAEIDFGHHEILNFQAFGSNVDRSFLS